MNKNIDTELYKGQAQSFVNSYEFDKAIVIYKRLIIMNPKSYDNHDRWARIRSNQGEYQLSELKFREVLALDLQNHAALNSLGIVLSKQGKYDQAISLYKKGLEMRPNHFEIAHNIAIAYTLKSDYEEAVEWYGKALKLNPSDESIHNCMGYLRFLQGKFQEAILKFDDAIKHNPQSELPYFNKVITLFCQSGIEEESRNAFELGVQAFTGGTTEKLHQLKTCVKDYNREVDRVRKELERDDLESEVGIHLEKIHKGLKYILGLLRSQIENLKTICILFEVD